MTAQQKGLASCLITGGYWTRKEQRERGYEVDEECPLCRAAPDSLRHRVLICEAVEEERKGERIRWLDEFRESPESHDELFMRGLAPHPGDEVPLPAAETQPILNI